MRHFPNKLDANHKEVADHLKSFGVSVIEIFQPLDLLCFYRNFTGLVEVKVDTKKELHTRSQLKFIAETPFPVAIVRNGNEAMQFLKTRSGLTERQKNRISGLLLRETKDLFTSKDVRDALAGER